jgi:hypothetical protein
MNPSENNIKKTVGIQPEKSPLQRLQELNIAIKKLGCKNAPEDSVTIYRKIVGHR